MVKVARLKQSLAWNAADPQASAAKLRVVIDTRCVHSELSRTNGCNVPTGTTTQNDDIVFNNFHGQL